MTGSDNHHVITLTGHLDISRYPEFRAEWERAPAGLPVLVDLSGAAGVDSIFLSELLLFRRRRRPAVVAVLIDGRSELSRVFALANIGEKLQVFTDLADAERALDETERP